MSPRPPETLLLRREEAERLAARLPPLLVEAERVAASVVPGLHGRRRSGIGETFWQYRLWQPGDDVRSIDWRASARSDRHRFVREQEWEAAQSVWIWADPSPSMDYAGPGAPVSKRGRAELLALALAVLLVRAGERVALLGSGRRPAGGRFGLERFAADLLLQPRGGGVEPAPLPAFARIVLLSDFLFPPAELEPLLRPAAAAGVRGSALQITDPSEEELPFSGRVLFEDPEDGEPALVEEVEELRGPYLALWRAHREEVAGRLARRGVHMGVHRTDRPAASGLLALWRMLAPRRAGG